MSLILFYQRYAKRRKQRKYEKKKNIICVLFVNEQKKNLYETPHDHTHYSTQTIIN